MEGNNLEAEKLKKSYGTKSVLKEFSLELQPGEILALAGENGAGKTTLMKILAGLLPADAGKVRICGISALQNPREAKQKIGYVPEQFGVYDSMRVQEYLEYFAGACGMFGLMARRRISRLKEQFDLDGAEQEYVDSLSAGMKQRLSIARCLLHDPMVLLLDEPMNHMDPKARNNFQKLMKVLAREGKSILASSHNLFQMEGLCTSVGFMRDGRLERKWELTALLKEEEKNNPLMIHLADSDQVLHSIELLRPLPEVRSIAVEGNRLMLTLRPAENAEKKILKLLLSENIATLFFGREKGKLEEIFIRMNQEKRER